MVREKVKYHRTSQNIVIRKIYWYDKQMALETSSLCGILLTSLPRTGSPMADTGGSLALTHNLI